MRSFSLVLLRRLLFRSAPQQQHKDQTSTLYDQLSSHALNTLERLLLHSLSHEPSDSVRRKSVDTVCDLANNAMSRGRPWHTLQAQAFNTTRMPEAGFRECAFRIFSGCPNLVIDLQTDAVISVFRGGLQDASVDVSPMTSILFRGVSLRLYAGPARRPTSLRIISDGLGRTPAFTVTTAALSDAGHPSLPPKRPSQDILEFLDAPLCFAPHSVRAAPPRTLVVLTRLDNAHCGLGTHTDRGNTIPWNERLVRFPTR